MHSKRKINRCICSPSNIAKRSRSMKLISNVTGNYEKSLLYYVNFVRNLYALLSINDKKISPIIQSRYSYVRPLRVRALGNPAHCLEDSLSNEKRLHNF